MAVDSDPHKRRLEMRPLGLTDGMVSAVVDQKDLDIHLVMDNGLQLL